MLKGINCSILLALLLLSTSNGLVSVTKAETVPNPDQIIIAKSGQFMNGIDPLGWNTELFLNVYEPLVFFDRDKTDSFAPRLATSWSVSPDGLNYTFTIRPGVKFHNGKILTTEDVEYSFERILVKDRGESYLFYDALFGLQGSRDENGNLVVSASQLEAAVEHSDTTVTFHLIRPRSDFMQILALFGLIVNKEWCAALGEWPGTWNNWTDYNGGPWLINQQNTDPPGPHVNAMCGTGPFMLEYFKRSVDYDLSGTEYSLIRFVDYWGGWPAPGSNGYVDRVTVKNVTDWATRREMFLAGQVDSLNVPTNATNEVLGQKGVRCIYPLPSSTCYEFYFNFNISSSSPCMGIPGGLPLGTFNESGIPPDFFGDINVRKGFACAFNYSRFIDEAFLGDASQPATPIVSGLEFYNPAQKKYMQNLTGASEFFQKAWNGQVWENGFNLSICIITSIENVISTKTSEILKTTIESINSKFHINFLDVSRDEWVNMYYDKAQAVLVSGWVPEYSDPYNIACGVMSSKGELPYYQNYENGTIDSLVNEIRMTSNRTRLEELYYELQRVYFEDCPCVPTAQPRLRRFERDWVQGWYYSPVPYAHVSPFNYFYVQWKESIAPHPLGSGENLVDDINSTDTIVYINTTSTGGLSITSQDIDIEGTIELGMEVHALKCVTVDTTVPHENITFPIEIRIYYTNESVVSAYVDQSTLRMYYWNETEHSWLVENDSGWVTPSDIQDYHNYTGYVWARVWHLSQFAAVGEATLVHSVAVKGVRLNKSIVGQGFNATIYADVFDLGSFDESFNVTVYANSKVIGTLTNLSLASGNSATIPVTWNTTGFARGNYTISVYASPVLNETATSDNLLNSDLVVLTFPGDVNGDFTVDIYDAIVLANAYNSVPTSSHWNSNADINGDGFVDIYDAIILANHYNQHYP